MQLNTIKKMERYARQDPTIISLGQGIPARSSDKRIQQVVAQKILSGSADHYSDPQGLTELRNALSQHVGDYGMRYEADEIIVTAGAIEALGVAVRSTIIGTKRQIIMPVPVYSAYFKLVELAGGDVVEVTLDEHHDWLLDPRDIIAAMTPQTAAVLLCNPNNPTGTVYPAETMQAITLAAKERGIAVIVDEVYRNMLYDDIAFYSPAQDNRFHDTVIRVMSFSKDFSLTGWRVGYLQASHKRIPTLLGIHDTLVNCTPVVSQHAALAALEIYDEIIHTNQVINEQNRLLMSSYLDKLPSIIDYTMPNGAYFLFPKIKDHHSSDQLALSLALSRVVTVPGSAFGSTGEGHLRLCFGRDTKSIRIGMDRLVRYFRS